LNGLVNFFEPYVVYSLFDLGDRVFTLLSVRVEISFSACSMNVAFFLRKNLLAVLDLELRRKIEEDTTRRAVARNIKLVIGTDSLAGMNGHNADEFIHKRFQTGF